MNGDGRVLVVDDFPDIAYSVCALLSLHGWQCRAALDGGSALDIAAGFSPDVLLTELELPDMTGYDLARELRVRAGGRRIRLAALTRHSGVSASASYRAGFHRHMLKPASRQMLLDAIAT